MYNIPRIIVTLYLVHLGFCNDNDWQYALSSIHELFDLELENIAAIETYIENENDRLNAIRRFIERREESNAKELAESYTESSINAFKTILRVKTDWEDFKTEMVHTTDIELKNGHLTNDTIVSALKALRRFQIIYELEVNEITNGSLGDYTFEKFDVDDCYQMASWCYDNAEFHCAYHWFAEARRKRLEENSTSVIDLITLSKKFAWSSYLVGDIDKAMEIMNKDILGELNHILTDELTNMRYIIWTGKEVYKRNTANDIDKKFYSHSLRKLDSNSEVRDYITTCQDFDSSPYLTCRYYHGRDKFLIIGPLREETVTLIPSIKLYYNVLFDNEIKKIKELAKPKLEKLSTDTDEDITLRKVATFSDHNDRVFDSVHNRLTQISPRSKFGGLNKYVVTNYGLNGHYLPHNKYVDEDHRINSDGRQAIVIFHMDDVPVGGDTVIPELSLRVPSVKGSALVVSTTRNIITPVGALFTNTQYGSCPIFYGDKWTLTAWLGDGK